MPEIQALCGKKIQTNHVYQATINLSKDRNHSHKLIRLASQKTINRISQRAINRISQRAI